MDELSRIAEDLDPALSDQERAELVATGVRLQAARPLPAPTFRGDLKRHLLGTGTARPDISRSRAGRRRAASSAPGLAARTLRARIATAATSGLGLLAITALGLVGAGPFAA